MFFFSHGKIKIKTSFGKKCPTIVIEAADPSPSSTTCTTSTKVETRNKQSSVNREQRVAEVQGMRGVAELKKVLAEAERNGLSELCKISEVIWE